jgi:large subunit ribosomal protein L14
MIQDKTLVTIADNTGAKIGRIFKVLGSSKKFIAQLGDVVVLSIQKAEPRKAVKKKDVVYGVVVRQRAAYRRKDGSYIRFDENAVHTIDKSKGELRTSSVNSRSSRKRFPKIASLAPEVVW